MNSPLCWCSGAGTRSKSKSAHSSSAAAPLQVIDARSAQTATWRLGSAVLEGNKAKARSGAQGLSEELRCAVFCYDNEINGHGRLSLSSS